ncbi:hypothetical protein J3E69DRAFT_348668 [Trichoderma sp. SZMC 28015]
MICRLSDSRIALFPHSHAGGAGACACVTLVPRPRALSCSLVLPRALAPCLMLHALMLHAGILQASITVHTRRPLKHATSFHWPVCEPLQRYFQVPGLNLDTRFASAAGIIFPPGRHHRTPTPSNRCLSLQTPRYRPRYSTMLHDAPRFGNPRPKPLSRSGC